MMPKEKTMKPHVISSNMQQQGAVLVVSLIVLLLMTIIGVSSIKTTTLEERMAGNLRDQNLAFQSAEAALIEGENFLENNVLIVTDSSSGIHDKGNAPDPFDAGTWSDDALSVAASLDINNEQGARYFIEKIGDVSGPATGKNLTFDPSGGAPDSGNVTGYQVVAIGRGASGQAQSVLVSFYGKKEFQ